MHGLPTLITDLTLIAIYAGITTLIFKWLKQPVVLGYVLAGIIAGPHLTFFPTVMDKENIQIWADIGVIFLLFGLGLEFSFKKILSVGKSAVISGMTNIIFLLFLGYTTGLLLGWSTVDSLFLGGMISMSSTTIIIKAFDELNLKKAKFTDIVFGILVVEDIVGILLLVLLPTIALSQSVNGYELFQSASKLVFFLVICFVIGIFIIPTFIKKIAKYLTDETLLIISIALCFSLVLMATSSGFSAALGAFIMGAILAETVVVHRIEHVLKPVKDFFGAVFFVSVGMMVNPLMFVEYAEPIFYIFMIVILGVVTFSSLGLLVSGQTPKTAVQCAFSLAQVGEFAFIIASLGLALGVLGNQVYPIIVAVSVLTTFTTPIMIKSALPFYDFSRKILPQQLKNFISKNVVRTKTSQAENNLWNALFKAFLLRVTLYSILLIALVNFSVLVIKPIFNSLFPNLLGNIILAFISLLLMAPFLNALLVSKSKFSKIYIDLWVEKPTNRLPLLMLFSIKLIIVSLFVMTIIHRTLTLNPVATFLIVLLTLFLLFKSKWISTQYLKIETRFLINLNREQVEQQIKETAQQDNFNHKNWLDTSLSVLRCQLVSDTQEFIGKSLKDLCFREKYALNVFKIDSKDHVISAPRSIEVLKVGDILTFVGLPKQLAKFKKDFSASEIEFLEPQKSLSLHEFILGQKQDEKSNILSCAFLVTPESELAHHTILTANIRNKTKCLVVGVERKSSLIINPESTFVFEENDLVWLIGEKDMMTQEVLHQLFLRTNAQDHI